MQRAEEIDYLEYLLPNRYLEQITLTDTPGTGSVVEEHQKVSSEFLASQRQAVRGEAPWGAFATLARLLTEGQFSLDERIAQLEEIAGFTKLGEVLQQLPTINNTIERLILRESKDHHRRIERCPHPL